MKRHLRLLTGMILFGSISLSAQDNFQITYSASGNEIIEWLIPSNDGNLLLGGTTDGLDPNGDGLIIKTDLNGNIIWSKIIGGTSQDQIVKMISCFDGGYVVIGNTSSYGEGGLDAWIIRINEDGEVIWSDCFGTYSYDGARGIVQTDNGGFIIVGLTMNFDGAFMLALNSQGDILWKKEYFKGIVTWFNNINKTEDGGYYVTGTVNHDGFGVHDIFILETTPTGNFVRCNYYGGQDDDSFRTLYPYEDGFLAFGNTWSYQVHNLGFVAKLNSDLIVENAIILGDNTLDQTLESACFFPNSIYLTDKIANGDSYIIELNPDLTLRYSWQFNPGYAAYSSHIIGLQDNSVIFAGSSTDSLTLQKDAYLAKFDPQEVAYDCNTVPHTTFIQNVNVQSSPMILPEINNYPVFQKLSIESTDITMKSQRFCIPLAIADFTGTEQACANDSVTFTNNSQNGKSYHWYFEGAIPAISDSIDPGSIVYENPGYYSIKLVVNNEAWTDSIVRYITIYPDLGFTLGPDTTILLTSNLQFITIGEYDSYLWSTGDTTPYLFLSGTGLELGTNLIWLKINNGPCVATDSISINVVDNSSISEISFPEILFYPNPASGSVQITGKSDELPSTVVFYNFTGKKVLTLHPGNKIIDINKLEHGLYIVELSYKDYNAKRKLVVL